MNELTLNSQQLLKQLLKRPNMVCHSGSHAWRSGKPLKYEEYESLPEHNLHPLILSRSLEDGCGGTISASLMGKPAVVAFFAVFPGLLVRKDALPPVSYAAYHAAYGTHEASYAASHPSYVSTHSSYAIHEAAYEAYHPSYGIHEVSYEAYHSSYGAYKAAYITDEPSSASPETVDAALQGANGFCPARKSGQIVNHQ